MIDNEYDEIYSNEDELIQWLREKKNEYEEKYEHLKYLLQDIKEYLEQNDIEEALRIIEGEDL